MVIGASMADNVGNQRLGGPMKPSRGTALAALVLVAVAAPFTAYAVSAGNDDARPSGHAFGHAKHGDKEKADKDKADKDKSDKPGHATGRDRAEEASAPGRAHADAMKAWAQCVAEAASGPKADDATTPPKEACGDKPMPPGLAKHAAPSGDSPGRSGDHRSSDRGRGHARGHGR